MLDWKKYGIELQRFATAENVKTTCPNCKSTRGNPNDRSLSCNTKNGLFYCHHCGFAGCADDTPQYDWRKELQNVYIPRIKQQDQMKEYNTPKDEPTSEPSDKMLAYFEKRGISQQTLKDWGVGYQRRKMPRKGSQQWEEMNCIVFHFYKNGKHINTKYRTAEKMMCFETGCELVPWGIDNIKDCESVIITEGEPDALTFWECGYHNVISVPNGASNNCSYLDQFIASHFENKKMIYIASDTDTNGEILRNELLRRFSNIPCKVVTYGDDCKDINEVLVKHGKEAVRRFYDEAKEQKKDDCIVLDDFAVPFRALFERGLQKGAVTGHANLDAVISWETKRVCVVTGVPSSGKSEFLDEIAVRLNLNYGWKFAYYSPENVPFEYHAAKLSEKLIGKRFGALGGDSRDERMTEQDFTQVSHYLDDNFFFIYPQAPTVDTIISAAEYFVRSRGIRGLVIDPYNRIDNEGAQSETNFVSKLMDKLAAFAQHNDCIVFLMAHPQKLKDKPDATSLYDISGSANFFNKADFAFIVHRIKDEQGNDKCVQIDVQKVKFKHLGEGGKVYFRYNKANGRYIPIANADDITLAPPDNRNYITEKAKGELNRSFNESVVFPTPTPKPQAPTPEPTPSRYIPPKDDEDWRHPTAEELARRPNITFTNNRPDQLDDLNEPAPF